MLEPVAPFPVAYSPGLLWPDPESSRRAQAAARAERLPATLWSTGSATALRMATIFFFLDPLDRVSDLLDAGMQA